MNAPDIAAAAVTLFFIMDPLGNIPLFNAVLSRFDPARRARIVAREMLFALVILLMFLFAGNAILSFSSSVNRRSVSPAACCSSLSRSG